MKFLGQLNENPLKETHIYKELPPPEVENTERKKVTMMVIGGHVEVRDPLMKEDILIKVRDPLIEEDMLIEDPPGGGYPHRSGRPLEEEDTLVEDPLMEMEDPLMVEDLLVVQDPLDLLVDKDHQALKDHLDQ